MPTKEQIVFLLSGGLNNSDPNKSLGGAVSHVPIFDGLNNLYDDLTPEQSELGTHIDYRCFYLKNASNQKWKNIVAYIDNYPSESVPTIESGAFVQIGVANRNDVQQISVISQGVTGGSFTLNFDGDDVIVPWGHGVDVWAANFQTALRNLDNLSEVTVAGKRVVTSQEFYIFTVTFSGADGNRNQSFLQMTANNLIGPGPITISETKIINGSPANSIAQEIPEETIVPSGVIFKYATLSDPVELGTLYAQESVPIWTKRFFLEPHTDYIEDKFTISIQGTAEINGEA